VAPHEFRDKQAEEKCDAYAEQGFKDTLTEAGLDVLGAQ
jgi:hypothetical protein